MKSRQATHLTLIAITMLAFALVAARLSEGSPLGSGDVSILQLAEGSQRFSVSGTVASVSYVSNTLRISAGSQTVDVQVTPTTVIEYHGEAGSMADIRRGSKISASGVVRNGQKVALSIILK